VSEAKEVVAIGDGAHWIWNLVEEHFPGAIQIVDWYHASEYVWKVAHAIYGEGSDLAKKWANERLDELWDGKVDEVLRHCQEHASAGEAVQQAITYFTNNKSRMRYPEYRARGLQIGSGTVECNWSSSQGFWDEMGCRRCKSCSQGEGKTQEWSLG